MPTAIAAGWPWRSPSPLVTAVLGAVGAALTGSLALLADLGHLLTDAGALVAALVAAVLAARPASDRRTYGFGRVEVLVAGLNALALVAVVGWVVVEGIGRLSDPADVPGLPLLIIGALGLVGNLVSLVVLNGGDRRNMNLRGAALHVLGDALGSVGVLAAAAVLLTTGWPYADTIASLFIAVLILPRAVALLREVWHVLLEGAPRHIDVGEVKAALLDVPGVTEVHDLHVWAINDRRPGLSAHVVVSPRRPPRAAATDRCSTTPARCCWSGSAWRTRPCRSRRTRTGTTRTTAADRSRTRSCAHAHAERVRGHMTCASASEDAARPGDRPHRRGEAPAQRQRRARRAISELHERGRHQPGEARSPSATSTSACRTKTANAFADRKRPRGPGCEPLAEQHQQPDDHAGGDDGSRTRRCRLAGRRPSSGIGRTPTPSAAAEPRRNRSARPAG